MNSSNTPKGMECRAWNGVEIQRRPSDGYVNATAMCQAGGKRWTHYLENARTKDYLRALAAQTGCAAAVAGIPATGKPDLIQTIQGGLPQLQGTWVHPRLAIDLARWIHPEFAVMMDGWFLESFTAKLTADPCPAPQALPKPQPQRLLLDYQVGGPGINVPGAEAFTAPLTEILDAYTIQTEAEQRALPQPAHCPSLRAAAPSATPARPPSTSWNGSSLSTAS